VRPFVEYALRAPTAGVTVHHGPLKDAVDANVQYLFQIPADDMLYWFRSRKEHSKHTESQLPNHRDAWLMIHAGLICD
jgi:hypothetical protein